MRGNPEKVKPYSSRKAKAVCGVKRPSATSAGFNTERFHSRGYLRHRRKSCTGGRCLAAKIGHSGDTKLSRDFGSTFCKLTWHNGVTSRWPRSSVG
jgi:hypothetical protein